MGDPNADVRDQIEEIQHQVQEISAAVARNETRMAGVEDGLAGLTDAFTTIATISHLRGAVAAAGGNQLALAPDTEPAGKTRRRVRVAAILGAAAAIAAAGYGAAGVVDDNTPAAHGGGSLTAARELNLPHGPAGYHQALSPVRGGNEPPPMPPSFTPNPPAEATARQPGTVPTLAGDDGSASTSAPAPLIASEPAADPKCRLGLQVQRVTVCRATAAR